MTTDRELLEAAARAANLPVAWRESAGCMCFTGSPYEVAWNPLADDAMAFSLIVSAGLQVTAYPMYDEPKHSVIVRKPVWNHDAQEGDGVEVVELYGDDPDAATRLAIVRAAAAMAPKGEA